MAGALNGDCHSLPVDRKLRRLVPLKGTNDVGRTHHPKPQIVVTVVRSVVIAVRSVRIVLVIVPGAAAHHPAVRYQRAPPALTGGLIIPQLIAKCKNRRGALRARYCR
jgi:hypothetical protein